jgi:hypothetical protein
VFGAYDTADDCLAAALVATMGRSNMDTQAMKLRKRITALLASKSKAFMP